MEGEGAVGGRFAEEAEGFHDVVGVEHARAREREAGDGERGGETGGAALVATGEGDGGVPGVDGDGESVSSDVGRAECRERRRPAAPARIGGMTDVPWGRARR